MLATFSTNQQNRINPVERNLFRSHLGIHGINSVLHQN